VSIRAVPKNSLIYQGNPDNDPCRDYGGAMGSVFKEDVDKGGGELCSALRTFVPDERHLVKNFRPFG
jgi:hypothetical protein